MDRNKKPEKEFCDMPKETTGPNAGEREFETMSDEAFKNFSQLTALNAKATFDQNQVYLGQLNNVALMALQNSVTQAHQHAMNCINTDNMVAKQAVAHRDVAMDATWDPGPGEESLAKK